MSERATRVFRVVVAFWLAAWFCNAPGNPGFWRNFVDAQHFALDYPALPGLLTSPRLALTIYLAPALVGWALVWPTRRLARIAAGLCSGCAAIACFHLETCNDATFVTAFWVSLWLNWFVWQAPRDDRPFYGVARGLAHMVVGMIFLGAVVGKLTGEYASGEAFYRLYFRDNPSWPYPTLRASFDEASLRGVAKWFTRSSLWAETMLALAPILPTRFVLVLGAATMLVMMSAWTFHLFSVLGSLLGLLIAAELTRRAEAAHDGE